MEVYFDQQLIGEAASGSLLASLIGGDRLELTVCTRIDGVDDNLDAVLAQRLTGNASISSALMVGLPSRHRW